MDEPDRLATQAVANRGVGGMNFRARALVYQC
jgi:hypothetical protein